MIADRKTSLVLGALLLTSTLVAVPTWAADAEEAAMVPVTVTFNKVRAGDVPFYVSIQTEDQYRSMMGSGEILQQTPDGTFTHTFKVPTGGDYAVSVWHDLDNDARFSMTQDYQILDGWGTSGTVPVGTAPSFSDAKVNVSNYGTNLSIDMIYPEG